MRLKTKNFDCMYLYQDGHAILKYKKRDLKSDQYIEWVEIIKTNLKCKFEGRIIIDSIGIAKLVFQNPVIEILKNNSSQACKELGFTVVSLLLRNKGGFREYIAFNYIPNLLSGGFYYQPEVIETWDQVKNLSYWSGYKAHITNPESESFGA